MDAVEALLYNGADPNLVAEDINIRYGWEPGRYLDRSRMPLKLAQSRGFQEIVQVLQVFGAEN